MTALPQDAVADLQQRIAELERQLKTAVNERDAAIDRQTASALVNFRLKNELRTATERQNASAEILRAIANTSGDAEQSLVQITEITARLFGAPSATLSIVDGDQWGRTIRVGASSKHIGTEVSEAQRRIGGRNLPGTVVRENRQIHIPDLDHVDASMADWPGLPPARASGTRVMSGTPLRRDGKAIGALIVYRDRLAAFTDDELALQQSFADQAVIAIENARLFNETKEALARQTATADILRVISGSPTDVQPVFDEIVLTAARLLRCDRAFIQRHEAGSFWTVAVAGAEGPLTVTVSDRTPVDPEANFPSRAIVAKETLHLPDWSAIDLPEFERRIRDIHGNNSALYMPLLRNGECIGLLALVARQANHFGASDIALAESFRDQALIAIENTRLFNETKEALERQTATADILKVIASSPSDTTPVFEAIAGSAKRLLGGLSAAVFRIIDDTVHLAAFTPINPTADAALNADFPRPIEGFEGFQLARGGKPFVIPDTEERTSGTLRGVARLHGFRSMLYVPLTNAGLPFGIITVTRIEPGPFAAHHIQLLQTFADQAVIAIENARLFNEVQERTVELTESLQQQTATSEVLQIISSSPGDLGPVFDKMLENATRVCGGGFGSMVLVEGDRLQQAAFYNAPPQLAAVRTNAVRELHPLSSIAAAVREKQVIQTEDIRNSPAYLAGAQHAVELAELGGARTIVVVPMLRDDQAIGVITVYRQEVRPFSEKQIDLLNNFAKQAVIAIENARLLRELRQRTDDLSESLQQQTATSEVLQIISSSPGDLTPVFDKMLENATRVCGAEFGSMLLVEGELVRQAALYNAPAALAAVRVNKAFRPHPQSALAAAIRTKQVCQVEDLRTQPNYLERNPATVEFVELGGVRTAAWVPMVRDNESIGVITIYRQEVHLFDDKQIELVRNFAKQAVIAIENARLLRELRQRTDDLTESLQFQTASAEVLKVISRSPDTLQPVLDVIVQTSRELCYALTSVIFLLRDGKFHLAAVSVDQSFQKPGYIEDLRNNPIAPDQAGSIPARATRDSRTIHIPNTQEDPEAGLGGPLDAGGPKALLCVPLTLDNRIIGAITLRQSHLAPFTQRQIEAVETFADQAVIAISNVNLFEQVQQRTRELTKSLDDLRTAQDRLVQTEKLASLGQLTAGIAHEIKNPLNFVNNFAALSAELTDELKDVLKPAVLDETIRAEVDEVTGLLKDNLSKVVQHGKRADSIVKNMLLHSREGSGEHRPADINALVDESLNLAYHGARAERPQFNVMLQRDFDPQAGQVEVFPQEITRVLLNLISNGFYAVTRRKADNGGAEFEPLVMATTRGRDDHVEIRIRDNGTGIPPEVKEKMFNPFFTTKPAGEGTGLGLSMSHDIIVKQHGGSIEVETEPGAFTEFRLVLPRTGRANGNR